MSTLGLWQSTVSRDAMIWDMPYQSQIRMIVPRLPGSLTRSRTSTNWFFSIFGCIWGFILMSNTPESLLVSVVIRVSSVSEIIVYGKLYSLFPANSSEKYHSKISKSDPMNSLIHLRHSTIKIPSEMRVDLSWRDLIYAILDLEIILDEFLESEELRSEIVEEWEFAWFETSPAHRSGKC